MIQMHRSPRLGAAILDSIYGALFFGVPNQGMAIESLVPMVQGQPNLSLCYSLSKVSQVLRQQNHDFLRAFNYEGSSEITGFYETMQSPTAVLVRFLVLHPIFYLPTLASY